MNSPLDAFTRHPASVGESWSEHAGTAWGFAWRLQLAALAALVHAVFPFVCETTASRAVTRLHERMVTHRRKAASPEPANGDLATR